MNRPQSLTWKALITSKTPATIIMAPTTRTLAAVGGDDAAERDEAGDEIDDAERDDPAPFGAQGRDRRPARSIRGGETLVIMVSCSQASELPAQATPNSSKRITIYRRIRECARAGVAAPDRQSLCGARISAAGLIST